MKLYLIRGLPGSGKSTLAAELAKALRAPHFEHDKYLYTPEGEYLWTPSRMASAYRACLRDTAAAFGAKENIVVSNVFPTARSMRNYVKLAQEFEYDVCYIVVENRRGGVNIHDVPQDALDGMRSSFQVEL